MCPLRNDESACYFASYDGSMSLSTVIDFSKKWNMSDITLTTRRGNSAPLYGNKTMLAMHSSYFKDMFFSGKPVEEKIAVDVKYVGMLEILKIIHNTDRKFGVSGHSLYSNEILAELYQASITLGMPLISQLCREQLLEVTAKDAFETCILLELHKEKKEALKKMSFADIEVYLSKKNEELVLTPMDVLLMVEKCQHSERTRCRFCKSTNTTKEDNTENETKTRKKMQSNRARRMDLGHGGSKSLYYCNACGREFYCYEIAQQPSNLDSNAAMALYDNYDPCDLQFLFLDR